MQLYSFSDSASTAVFRKWLKITRFFKFELYDKSLRTLQFTNVAGVHYVDTNNEKNAMVIILMH